MTPCPNSARPYYLLDLGTKRLHLYIDRMELEKFWLASSRLCEKSNRGGLVPWDPKKERFVICDRCGRRV